MLDVCACGKLVNSEPNEQEKARSSGRYPRAALTLIAILVFARGGFAQTPQGAAKTQSSFSPRDLSGVWMEPQNTITFGSEEPLLQPWAQDVYKNVKPGYGPRASADSEDPILRCLPPGVPRIMLIPFPMQIVQSPGEVILLFEYDHYVRHIYLNRRAHPKELDLTWMGDSIGWWEANTLVVDTVGLNDKTWLDQVGHPHSDALHVVERIERLDRDTLQNDVTIDDPRAFKKTWGGRQLFKLRPTWHLMEYACGADRSGLGK